MKKILVISLTILAVLSMTVAAFADSTTIYSDTSVMVYGPLDDYAPLGDPVWGTANPAVITWQHPSWPLLTDPLAQWISNSYYIEGNIAGNTWRLFSKTVDLCDGAYDISGTINATADNAEEAYVNGDLVGYDGEVQGAFTDNHEWATINEYYYEAEADTLTFDFIVRNYSGTNDPETNPTGLLFDASIDYSCPIEVAIDIKPGSDPSCFNNDGHGVIPVAILGSADFDVYTIDPGTVQLEGLVVAAKGKSNKLLAAYEDVNGDGYTDLVIKIEDADGTFTQGSGYATLTGSLSEEFGGTPIQGTGDICITQ
jgi:hypothetical protein